MKTGKNIFAKVTLLNKGQDEHPNRKLGKGSGVNRKFTRGNANAKNFTFTNNKRKTNETNAILFSTYPTEEWPGSPRVWKHN